MKAVLVYWHKARLQGRYVLEMEIYEVDKSARYRDGVKYGLILTDLRGGKRVLMDNHHPKGPHIHLDDRQISYQYIDVERLVKDFKALVLTHMEVKI